MTSAVIILLSIAAGLGMFQGAAGKYDGRGVLALVCVVVAIIIWNIQRVRDLDNEEDARE